MSVTRKIWLVVVVMVAVFIFFYFVFFGAEGVIHVACYTSTV